MKKDLLQSALVAVAGLFGKYASMGVKIDTQESDFKRVQQAVNAALDAPDDVEILPEIVAPSIDAEFKEGVIKKLLILEQALEKLDGFEDALGVLIAAIPEPVEETAPEEAPAV